MLAKHKLADPWHNKTKEKDGWLPTNYFFLGFNAQKQTNFPKNNQKR